MSEGPAGGSVTGPGEHPADALARAARALRQSLLFERAFGRDVTITWSPLAPIQEAPQAAAAVAAREGAHIAAAQHFREDLALPEDLDAERLRRLAILDPLRQEVLRCTACVLCQQRTQAVFGVGDPCARLLFVGEGPGEEEDRQGEPFVGKAGQLLTRMIQAMGLERRDVYIANIVKCRPPGNRNPEPREIISCMPYLRRQIEVIRPQVICALGNVAARSLLETPTSISRLRGHFAEALGIPVMPTFHPSYLLRNPEDKRLAWMDLRKLMDFLGLHDPRSSGESPGEDR